jgi:hypothetical protein
LGLVQPNDETFGTTPEGDLRSLIEHSATFELLLNALDHRLGGLTFSVRVGESTRDQRLQTDLRATPRRANWVTAALAPDNRELVRAGLAWAKQVADSAAVVVFLDAAQGDLLALDFVREPVRRLHAEGWPGRA